MARAMNQLSAAKVAKLTKPGRYGDGGGLWLQVSRYGTKSWLFRYMIDGRARQMGLGSVETFSLKEARERARLARQLVVDGRDPIEERNDGRARARAEEAKRITVKDAADRYIKAHREGWKSAKHADQWARTMETYVRPVIGHLPVALVETHHVLKVIEPIWGEKPETANRVRGRIEAILDWAKAAKYRDGDNPARWRGHLDKLLPPHRKLVPVKHHAALKYKDVGAFMVDLRARDSVSARALEFTILTVARTGETIGARWSEIDFEAKLWNLPASRMKSGRPHFVPLSDRVIEILEALPREGGKDGFLFPGARKNKPLSNMAMLELLRGMERGEGLTVHGFRSTFRDWAGDATAFPRDLAELALAHRVGDDTELAYRRASAIEKRRKLMAAWASFCGTVPSSGSVLPLRGRSA